jgi:hypothetical protein
MDALKKWMDDHLIVMTLDGDKKKEDKLKKAVHESVRKKLTTNAKPNVKE